MAVIRVVVSAAVDASSSRCFPAGHASYVVFRPVLFEKTRRGKLARILEHCQRVERIFTGCAGLALCSSLGDLRERAGGQSGQMSIRVRPGICNDRVFAGHTGRHWSSAERPSVGHLPTEQRPWHWSSAPSGWTTCRPSSGLGAARRRSPVRLDHLPAVQPWH